MPPADPAALLLLVNGVDPARLAEYEAWHGTEHVPERLTLPGFRHADRYVFADDPCRFATLYWLDDAGALATPEYLHLMAHPSPWSARMRPAMRDVTRWAARVVAGAGRQPSRRLVVLSYTGDADPHGLAGTLADKAADGEIEGWSLAERFDAPAHPGFPARTGEYEAPRLRCCIGLHEDRPLPPGILLLQQEQQQQQGHALHLSLIGRIERAG